MAVPTPLDWAANAGLSPTAGAFQAGVGDVFKFLLDPPRVALRQGTAQSIPTASYTALTFATEDYDNETPTSMHSLVSNQTRITAVTAGTYLVGGKVSFANNANGRRGLRWFLNGTTVVPASEVIGPANATGTTSLQARVMAIALGVGDYVELQAFQDTAGSLLTAVSGTETQPAAEARWIGP